MQKLDRQTENKRFYLKFVASAQAVCPLVAKTKFNAEQPNIRDPYSSLYLIQQINIFLITVVFIQGNIGKFRL